MKRKGNLKILKIILIIILSIVICVFGTIIFIKYCIRPIDFNIENRNTQIKKAKKKDNQYDTVGWIRVQGTDIDYPILRSKDFVFTYPVERDSFAWSLLDDDKIHKKIDLMGHNIFNLSSNPIIESDLFERFEQLMAFVYYDFAKENKYIQLTIDGKDYVYKIYAVDFVYSTRVNEYITADHDDKKYISKLYKEYINDSLFDYDVDVNDNDSFISLITCTRFFGPDPTHNFVVNGRLLRKDEKIRDYDVVINEKNYKKIDDILKGDDENGKEESA